MASEDRVSRLRQEVAEAYAVRHDEWVDMMLSRCGSPIEQLFFLGMLDAAAGAEDVRWLSRELGDLPSSVWPVVAWPQATVGKYTADFLFCCLHGNGRRVVVECDGHDFHERTKAQARHDRSRDRWMVSQGITVLRFTGSELYADPPGCAEQVWEVLFQ